MLRKEGPKEWIFNECKVRKRLKFERKNLFLIYLEFKCNAFSIPRKRTTGYICFKLSPTNEGIYY